jgi:hypothetical protein
MDGREIPGFYFDTEKKKYFKIQHASKLKPDAKYSIENVKKEQKKQKIVKDASMRIEKRQKETIVRRHVRDPLMHASLDREMGLRSRSYYVERVWPDACVSGFQNRPQMVVKHPERASIRFFDRDPATKTIYAVHADNTIKRRRLNPPDGIPLPSADLDLDGTTTGATISEYSFEPWDELARLTSSISSLSYLPASGALVATTYGSDRPPLIYLTDPDRDGPYVHQTSTLKKAHSIWTAAARPLSFHNTASPSSFIPAADADNVAVGTSDGLMMFTRPPTGSWESKTVFRSSTDVLAVEWLSPQVVAMGCRSGRIYLHDTRSKGSSHILTHPFPISSLKRADDETRLVCTGLEDAMYLYDIRHSRWSHSPGPGPLIKDSHYNQSYFEELYPGSRSRSKRRKLLHVDSRSWSQPVFVLEHSNVDDLALAVDLHPRLGLVAAAQDSSTTSTAIKIHNMWTGKVVKEIRRDVHAGQDKAKIWCLKFMEDAENGDVDLWANWDGGIARFKW